MYWGIVVLEDVADGAGKIVVAVDLGIVGFGGALMGRQTQLQISDGRVSVKVQIPSFTRSFWSWKLCL